MVEQVGYKHMISKTKKQAINKAMYKYYETRLMWEITLLASLVLVLLHQTGILVMVP
jgi:hypothetical protein